eukprot:TRINITY_DN3548_c1_g1_i1.p1 TRINITY_DN3548_c1_g1~~TRINITY_DN3548_c1_g1_i1.p1  ORF type:complete len:210 (-),score=58.31 TRINITY_DN3548_c1_g1_i1:1-630(-)
MIFKILTTNIYKSKFYLIVNKQLLNYRNIRFYSNLFKPLNDIVIIDPIIVYNQQLQQLNLQEIENHRIFTTSLPQNLYKLLIDKQMTEVLDDFEPRNYFYIGEKAEIFEYNYAGRITSESGLFCIFDKNSFDNGNITSTIGNKSFNEWLNYLKLKQFEMIQNKNGILFCANLRSDYGLDGADIYKLNKQNKQINELTGLMISSSFSSDE